VTSGVPQLLPLSKLQETSDDANICKHKEIVELFVNPNKPGFFFTLLSGLRVPLQSILVGTFALIESTSRDALLDAMVMAKISISAFIRFRLKESMSREFFTITWRKVNDAIFCKREVRHTLSQCCLSK
jgi:hypothetical protein